MLIDIPSDEFLNILKVKGDDIGTMIYPWGLFVFADDGSIDPFGTCYNLFFDTRYASPLAAGTVDAVFTDNNSAADKTCYIVLFPAFLFALPWALVWSIS